MLGSGVPYCRLGSRPTLPARRPALRLLSQLLRRTVDLALELDDPVADLFHRVPDDQLVPGRQRDDRIRRLLDRFDQIGVHHDRLAVQPLQRDHLARVVRRRARARGSPSCRKSSLSERSRAWGSAIAAPARERYSRALASSPARSATQTAEPSMSAAVRGPTAAAAASIVASASWERPRRRRKFTRSTVERSSRYRSYAQRNASSASARRPSSSSARARFSRNGCASGRFRNPNSNQASASAWRPSATSVIPISE